MASLEVVIVGGGPAGVSTALFLAHHRPDLTDRVVILEKDAYPRDKYCAGAIGGRADKALATLGVQVDVPSVPINGVSAAFRGGCVTLREGEIGRVVRRIEFDHALAEEARARGICIREGTRVSGVTWDAGDGDVAVETSQGTLRARVVVGADGVGSVVRRAMGLPFGRVRAQVVEVDTEPVSGDGERDVLHFDLHDHRLAGYSWDFPTLTGGRELVCRGTYVLHTGTGPAPDAEAVLRERMAAMGLDLDRYRQKRFSERGFDPGLVLSRPGALLVGEAAGIDPLLGEGIPQAIDYGKLAGEYLATRLAAGDRDFADWSRRVATSRMGKDLRVRTRILPAYFGALRDPVERYVLGQPAFLRTGMQYFAGKPISRASALKVAATSAAAAARVGIAALFGG